MSVAQWKNAGLTHMTCRVAAVIFEGDDGVEWKQPDSDPSSMIMLSHLGVEDVRVLAISPDHSIRHDSQRQWLGTVSTSCNHHTHC